MKAKQILATIASAAIAVGLAACGGSAAPGAQPGSQPAAQSSSGASAGGSAPASAPATVQAVPTTAPTAAPTTAPTAAPRPAVQPTSAPPQQASSGIGDLASRAQGTGDYSYDMKMDVASMQTSGKMFVKGTKIRQELTAGSISTVQIVDSAAKVIYNLMPDQKIAMKMDITQVQGGTTSPTEQVTGIPADAKMVGSETVDGKQTSIYQYTKDGTTAKLWIWTEKGLPLKAEMDISGVTAKMTFSNYQFATLDAALFQIPSDYKIMDRPNQAPAGSGQMPPVQGAQAPLGVPTRTASAPATPVVIQAAPTPTQVSTIVAPPLANASVLPAELKPVPIPPGFAIVDKTVRRSSSGGVFRSASVQLWGTKSIDEVVSFYTTALAADWTSYNEIVRQDYLDLTYFLTSDEGRSLQFTGQASAEGLYIDVMLRQE